MKRAFFALALLVAGSTTAQAVPPANSINGSGAGGGGSAAYYPSRSTVSPYLTLTPQFGGFGGYNGINYYTFIRPELHQQQINQQQSYNMNQLQQQQQLLNGQQPIYGQNGLPAIRSTGTRSWYMTHQQYFGAGSKGGMTGGGPQRGMGGTRTYSAPSGSSQTPKY